MTQGPQRGVVKAALRVKETLISFISHSLGRLLLTIRERLIPRPRQGAMQFRVRERGPTEEVGLEGGSDKELVWTWAEDI